VLVNTTSIGVPGLNRRRRTIPPDAPINYGWTAAVMWELIWYLQEPGSAVPCHRAAEQRQ
jgi:hypothetical protein